MSSAEVDLLSAGPLLTLTLNPAVDVCWDVDHLADVGKNRARVRSVTAGGGGINVARGVARLGGRAVAIHTAGREVGMRLNRLLDEEGIDHIVVQVEGETREAFVLLETESRRSHHIVPPGPHLARHEGQRCLDALEGAIGTVRYVVASGSLPGDCPTTSTWPSRARSRRPDPGWCWIPPGRRSGVGLQKVSTCSGATVLKPPSSSAELSAASTMPEPSTSLLTTGATEVAVTTIGELGALCSTRDGHTELRAPTLPGRLLSDAGAGDSMVAALTTGLNAGEDLIGACARGVAAAAASVLTPGTESFDLEVVESLRLDVRITLQRGR
ncbi:PfkB family carbohydrate kinase [Streptomyces sp. NPDC006875]|uniref:1-phosphofructokinase family hexose kinase n=1 Tax=Streptomyces sp. NPDC006875 TaxID=3154781 RepID=UPI0033E6B4C7